jgi:hypothetical protein
MREGYLSGLVTTCRMDCRNRFGSFYELRLEAECIFLELNSESENMLRQKTLVHEIK